MVLGLSCNGSALDPRASTLGSGSTRQVLFSDQQAWAWRFGLAQSINLHEVQICRARVQYPSMIANISAGVGKV